MKTTTQHESRESFLNTQDAEFNSLSEVDQVKSILEWIKLEKSKECPNGETMRQAVRDIEAIKGDYRILGGGQYGNQNSTFI